jgi:hypothetical protein
MKYHTLIYINIKQKLCKWDNIYILHVYYSNKYFTARADIYNN